MNWNEATFLSEADMINIGNRRECFFDDYLIDTEKSTARLTLNKPMPKQVVMEFNKAWEGNASYVHFFFDEGIYRMYYIAWNKDGVEDKRIIEDLRIYTKGTIDIADKEIRITPGNNGTQRHYANNGKRNNNGKKPFKRKY